MTRRLILTLGAAALIVAGCASPREHYYTLVPESLRESRIAAAPARGLVVEPVTVPQAEERPQLVIDVTPHEQAVLEQERWIEPLAADLQRAVAVRLAAALADTAVRIAGDHGADAAARHLYVQVRRFGLSLDHGARLEAHWAILGADRSTLREGDFAQQKSVTSRSYAALVQAQAATVAALADQLAGVLQGLP